MILPLYDRLIPSTLRISDSLRFCLYLLRSKKTCQMENVEHKVENDIYGEQEQNSDYESSKSSMEYKFSASENQYEIAVDEPAIYEVPN